jgi:hypothetical protein
MKEELKEVLLAESNLLNYINALGFNMNRNNILKLLGKNNSSIKNYLIDYLEKIEESKKDEILNNLIDSALSDLSLMIGVQGDMNMGVKKDLN